MWKAWVTCWEIWSWKQVLSFHGKDCKPAHFQSKGPCVLESLACPGASTFLTESCRRKMRYREAAPHLGDTPS